jgi:hypothetical protein
MRKFIVSSFIFLFVVLVTTYAQLPPHPNGGIGPNSGQVPVGGGAPIGGSFLIMLSLALGYGTRKVYEFRKRSLEEMQ